MPPAWCRLLPRHALHLPSLLLWVVVACIGCGWLVLDRLQQLHAAFETDARIVHRLLSQRVVQHDAIMATLALLQPATAAAAADSLHNAASPLPRLPSVYPQILAVLQRSAHSEWPPALQAELAAAEATSRRTGHAAMAGLNLPAGRYYLVLAGTPASYALHIDLRTTIPTDEWPMDMATSPVRVTLEHGGTAFVVQPGQADRGSGIRTYDFHKLLAAPSQPLDVVARRSVGLHELPWWRMLGWCLLTAALWAAGRALWRQRVARQRAEELLRLGQVARLNTLGELAAGMAHELKQPLTALLSSTQAAQRLPADDPPDIDTAQTAMARAVEQARRASTVVGRLRRLVERPDLAGQAQPLALPTAVQDVLHLLEPELAQRGVVPEVLAAAALPPGAGRARGPAADHPQPADERAAGAGAGAARRAPAAPEHGTREKRAGDPVGARPRPRHPARGAPAPVRALLHHAHRRAGPGPHTVREPGTGHGSAARPGARGHAPVRRPAGRRVCADPASRTTHR